MIDGFFTQNLAPLVDMSGPKWTWRQDSPLARALRAATLRAVPARGADPRRLLRDRRQHAVGHVDGDAAVMAATAPPPPSTPAGAPPQPQDPRPQHQARHQRHGGREQARERAAKCAVAGAGTNRAHRGDRPACSRPSGRRPPRSSAAGSLGAFPAARCRLDACAATASSPTSSSAADDVAYQFTTRTPVLNPLTLPALREFRCPTGLEPTCGAGSTASCRLKRDFIAIADAARLPRQSGSRGCRAACRRAARASAQDWQAAFLRAPIWRFWLGAELCGTTVPAPSCRRSTSIGRYFPLTSSPAPTPAWRSRRRSSIRRMLGSDGRGAAALGARPEAEFEAVKAAVERLQPPSDRLPARCRSDDAGGAAHGRGRDGSGSGRSTNCWRSSAPRDHASAYAAASFWWTTGGEGYRPLAMMQPGACPTRISFTAMLTGAFQAAAS